MPFFRHHKSSRSLHAQREYPHFSLVCVAHEKTAVYKKKETPTLIVSRRVAYPSLPPIQCYAEKTKTNPSPKKR